MPNSSRNRRGIAALPVLAVVFVLGLLVVGLIYFVERSPSNTNTGTIANRATNTTSQPTNTDSSVNATPSLNTNPEAYDFFIDTGSRLVFRYPEYLTPRPRYPYDLDTIFEESDIQTVSVESVRADDAAAGFEGFIDSVSLELLDLTVATPLHSTAYNNLPAFEKVYTASATTRISGRRYEAKVHDLAIKAPSESTFLFIRVYGRRTPAFDEAVRDIFSSVTLRN